MLLTLPTASRAISGASAGRYATIFDTKPCGGGYDEGESPLAVMRGDVVANGGRASRNLSSTCAHGGAARLGRAAVMALVAFSVPF
jgi:hypothetical protein